MAWPEGIELVQDFSFLDIVESSVMLKLYNYAADEDIALRLYVDRGDKDKNSWISLLNQRVILIPVNLDTRKIALDNIWLQKIYLVHEIANFKIGVLGRCKIPPEILKESRYPSCLYYEIMAWILGWEILRFLDLVLISEKEKYKRTASIILKRQCKNCIKILKEEPGKCPYAVQIENLLKANKFDCIGN